LSTETPSGAESDVARLIELLAEFRGESADVEERHAVAA
jgi:hypothetical protein